METKAVIFDYDGVLVDSIELNHKIYSEIAKHFNNQLFKDFKGNRDNIDVDWKETLRRAGISTPEEVAEVIRLYRIFHEEHKDLAKLVPGMEKVLKQLKKKYLLGVASNNFSSEIARALEEYSVAKYFDAITGAEKEILKPDPAVILDCMRELGVKPEEAVYVGDMEGDIRAGKNARCKKTVAVTFGFHSHDRLKDVGADIIIHKPEQLLEAVR